MNMKKYIVLAFCLIVFNHSSGQALEGKVQSFFINAKSLQNTGGENPNRKVSVYLPPGYEGGRDRYPVIYYLHGFMGKDSIYASMKSVLDEGIRSKKIRPFILVQADQYTLYEGSFYSNSSLTGNWEEFTAKELVAHIDKTYRTLTKRESRGIAGHSMGGYGAFKIGMLHPDVFSS